MNVKKNMPGFRYAAYALLLASLLRGWNAEAQRLRFATGHREIAPPGYVTFFVGPVGSHFRFSQAVGARYSEGTTNVVDIVSGARQGAIRANGVELPMETEVSLMNYLRINRYMDLDASLWARYEYYPLDTQDDIFTANFTDPEISGEFATALSMEFHEIKSVRVRIRDNPAYLVSYVDRRGYDDPYGGLSYHRFENTAGMDVDALVQSDINIGATVSRRDVLSPSSHFKDQESVSHSASVIAEYEVNRLVTAGLRAGVSTVAYTVENRGDFRQDGCDVFAEADLTRTSRGRMGVGYARASLSSTNETGASTERGTVVADASFEAEISRELSCRVSCGRSYRPGFSYGIEEYSSADTSLRWQRGDLSADLSAGLRSVGVVTELAESRYASWQARLELSYSLARGAALRFRSVYEDRDNETFPAGSDIEEYPDLTSDYATWENRAEIAWVFNRRLNFLAYAFRTDRTSGDEAMKYERMGVGADCRYVYEY